MGGTERRRKGSCRVFLRRLAVFAGIGCFVAAGVLTAQSFLEERAYRALPAGAVANTDASQQTLLPHTLARLTVAGTNIDYPVMQLAPSEPADFYLTHNAWGEPSDTGCPYLDPRCEPDGPHLLVYGHATGFPARMFGSLRNAYRPEVFAGIGAACWQVSGVSSDEGGAALPSRTAGPVPPQRADTVVRQPTSTAASLTFEPLCALKVDQSFADIQRFTLNAGADVAAFAQSLARQASVSSPDWETQAQRARRVLTLVTCSQAVFGTRDRTLVIFTLS